MPTGTVIPEALLAATDPAVDEAVERLRVASGEAVDVDPSELVGIVWYFARARRLGELEDVTSAGRELQRRAVAAFDLLEGARRRAMVALVALLAGADDLDACADAVVELRPLFRAELARVERLIEPARTSSEAGDRLRRELRHLVRRVEAAPRALVLTTIADLDEGHVRAITAAAGLGVGDDDTVAA